MAKTHECCSALSLRRTGDDLHVSLHKGFKIRLAGIVPVFIEFTGVNSCPVLFPSYVYPTRSRFVKFCVCLCVGITSSIYELESDSIAHVPLPRCLRFSVV